MLYDWILEPEEMTLTVYRHISDAYPEILIAERGEEVHPSPCKALPLRAGARFGNDESVDADPCARCPGPTSFS